MLKLIIIAVAVTVCYAQTTAPLATICKFVNKAHCNLYAHHPECGSNGKTYDNRCYFSQAHCVDTSLRAVHNGTCTSTSGTTGTGSSAVYQFFCQQMTHNHCGPDVEHLCGSDNKNYDNFCMFEKGRCTNSDLYIAKYDKC